MQRDELWAAYYKRNPSFSGTGDITMSAAGLKKLFDQTFEAGHKLGLENGKALAGKPTKPKFDIRDLFGGPS